MLHYLRTVIYLQTDPPLYKVEEKSWLKRSAFLSCFHSMKSNQINRNPNILLISKSLSFWCDVMETPFGSDLRSPPARKLPFFLLSTCSDLAAAFALRVYLATCLMVVAPLEQRPHQVSRSRRHINIPKIFGGWILRPAGPPDPNPHLISPFQTEKGRENVRANLSCVGQSTFRLLEGAGCFSSFQYFTESR